MRLWCAARQTTLSVRKQKPPESRNFFHNLLHHHEVKKEMPLRPECQAMADEIKTMQQEIERLQLLKNHQAKRMWLIIEEELRYCGEMDMDTAWGIVRIYGATKEEEAV